MNLKNNSPSNIFLNKIYSKSSLPAIFFNESVITYSQLIERIENWKRLLISLNIKDGAICAVFGEFSHSTCSLMLALISQNAIIVPISRSSQFNLNEYIKIASVRYIFKFDQNDDYIFEETISNRDTPNILKNFQNLNEPGLIIFSSGTTGSPKGILHSFNRILGKFEGHTGPSHRSILFLLMDHLGGINTFLSAINSGGLCICLSDRTTQSVCSIIQSTSATLLPSSPTFLNLLLVSKDYINYDLTSVKLITYGTEVMPENLLLKLNKVFKSAHFKQTYGLSELGVLSTKTENNNSVWIKVSHSSDSIKIIDSTLWIKSNSNMIGYLNAPSPFNAEGWMCTGDKVESKGEYIKFIGRNSDIVNIGGEKVFPSEIENLLILDENILDATVYGVKNQLMGFVLNAEVCLFNPEPIDLFSSRIRKKLSLIIPKFKIPVKYIINNSKINSYSERFKKIR